MLTGVGAASAIAQASSAEKLEDAAPTHAIPTATVLPIYMVDETRVERQTIRSADIPPGTYIFYCPSPDDHFPPIMKVAESNDEMVAALVEQRNEAERADERERCINIIESMVDKRPRQTRHASCSYGVPFDFPTAEQIADQNHRLKLQWSIDRLRAKSMIARIRAVTGDPQIPLDEDDNLAIMELGLIP